MSFFSKFPEKDEWTDRTRGYQGTSIQVHRALRRKAVGIYFCLQLLGLPALAGFLILCFWTDIRAYWLSQFIFWSKRIALTETISLRYSNINMVGDISAPYLVAGVPTLQQSFISLLMVLSLLLVSSRLPDAYLPVKYFVRFIAFIQFSALFYFFFFDSAYPYSSQTYLLDMVELSAIFLMLLPWFLGLVYLVIIQSAWRYLLLTGLAATYIVILTPLQYTLHAFILDRGSLLYHPILYFLCSLLPQIMGVMGLYSWALSWRKESVDSDY
jgi:hypothetical protein